MRLTSPFTIELTRAEREVLERLADSRTAPFGQVQRASVILALAEGMSNAATARAAGRHVDTVRSWRKRFTAERLAALVDRPRPLGRPRLSAEDKLQVIAAATAQPPTADSVWTHRLLSDHLRRSGLAVSASQVGRILACVDLKPHLVRGWLTRPADPEFFTRAADVCALYGTCPANAVVISVDEKTGITARSRKHPDQPGRPGQRTRREFEYIRHGTVSIIAALNVHTGQVLTERIDRNNADTFIGFLRQLNESITAGTSIHLVITTAHPTSRRRRRPGWPPVPASNPPHPRTRQLAQPSRAVLLHPDPTSTTPRPVRLPRRTGRGHRHLRLGLRRTRRQALPLDLRRQPTQSRMNPRRINAALH
ncbi:IS630 family transposase [Actinoallomurus purpureus]|uniref:IS630 family transposase n=1 Tax=Actinoallomurus purpureus TaxID=478114 RepID=UPI0020929F45|nr:IS630 family transposase [Actinoallomurus purpureus]MCO6003917.1 IS630 family transposase [Actinoallomurus purpureus]